MMMMNAVSTHSVALLISELFYDDDDDDDVFVFLLCAC